MDIGIMPLEKHEWSPKKGGYKLYLYMAAGLAVIGTPVGINGLIVKDGYNGFWAKTEDDWAVALKTLYQDKELRTKMGVNSRNDAVQLYSYKACTKALF